MPRRTLATIRIDDFTGLVSNRGKFPERPGDASVQTNVRSIARGDLAVRKGMRGVDFGASPAGTGDVLSIYHFDRNGSPCIVVAGASGAIDFGTEPE